MRDNIEPLAAPLWFQRVAIVASGALGSVENSLRHASHLVQLAPLSFRQVLPSVLDEGGFESLLEEGYLDTAARQLLGPNTTLLIETDIVDHSARAVICCAMLKRSIDATGDTVASAILSAWANWLMTLRLEFGTDLGDEASQAGPSPEGGSAGPGAS